MRLSLTRLATLVFAIFTVWLTRRLHARAARDPTSLFFNPRTGYAPRYSLVRRQQALDYIGSAQNTSISPAASSSASPPPDKNLCVGIPSIARPNGGYLAETIGSLLSSLTPPERASIHLIVLIPHTTPSLHPSYAESWLHILADDIVTYADLPAPERDHIVHLEATDGPEYLTKGLFDYQVVLQRCAAMHTPYIAVFEDDVVAMEGWYARAMRAVERAEWKSAVKHASLEFLYLRLFYTEEFLGWNRESWGRYLFWSAGVWAVPMGLLLYLRERYPGLKARGLSTRGMGLFAWGIVAVVGFYFALGRIAVSPLQEGVQLMQNFGCCSQALVFPRGRALMLATYMAERGRGAPDVLIEEYANEKGELRWAVSPSLVQHIGRKSSKKDDFGEKSKYGMSVAEKIWSFGFEEWDPRILRDRGVA
ncbi:hypothetical protein BU23DRAFT_255746 [Bimuria novae-zelandiae CBS 107.79]|uniref:Integral membrane protein-like protein n=1 Tax=Bimuria novae-zelandiae CBS 107.79 TaxID=1447943 RepID=A0A6A5UUQ5_9PLEO|nr:hypothetical protein BU23DRAFT_255746 [Bimuria novae-zelandiae CBS 107.79]